jgi:mannose-6-phosphate isomerase-like protein (cupin superfamily)
MARKGQIMENPVTGERFRWHLTEADTGGRLVRAEAWVNPGGGVRTEHFHPHSGERFEVLSGRMTLERGGEPHVLLGGDRTAVAPGVRSSMERTCRTMAWVSPSTYAAVASSISRAMRPGPVTGSRTRSRRRRAAPFRPSRRCSQGQVQGFELLAHGRRDRRRQAALAAAPGRARELAQEERVARGLVGELARVGDVAEVVEHCQRGLARERLEHDVLALRSECLKQARRGLARARGEHHRAAGLRWAPQHVEDPLERGGVGPLEVVEQERGGPLAREQLDERAQRAVVAEALAGARGGARRLVARRARGRRQHGRELGPGGGEARRRRARGVVVERVDHEPERDAPLVLRGAAVHDAHSPRDGELRRRDYQRALADPGLADDQERAHEVAGVERGLDRLGLLVPPPEPHGPSVNAPPGRGYSGRSAAAVPALTSAAPAGAALHAAM